MSINNYYMMECLQTAINSYHKKEIVNSKTPVIAQLVERLTVDQLVVCSIQTYRNLLWERKFLLSL